jgi:hypothetical protein
MAESSTKPTGLREIAFSRQAVKDLQEMAFILRRLFVCSPCDLQVDTLRRSLKDPILPIRSARNPVGRNAQAELYGGAILHKAGLDPRKCDPPDYRFTFEGTEWALEVKRLQSEKRLEQRIREGFHALEDSQATGLLLLDLSQALRSEPSRSASAMPELFGSFWSQRVKRFVRENCSPGWLREVRRGREIRGLVVNDHFVVPDEQAEWCLHSLTFGVCIDGHNRRRERQFQRVFAAIERGTATPSR